MDVELSLGADDFHPSFLRFQVQIHTTCIQSKVFQHVDEKRRKKNKLLSKVTEETYFLYKRPFKKSGTVNTLLRSGCAKDSVNN